MNAKAKKNWNTVLTISLVACVVVFGLGVSGAAASISIWGNNILNGNFEQISLSDYQSIVLVQGPFTGSFSRLVSQGVVIQLATASVTLASTPLQGDTLVLVLQSGYSSASLVQGGVTWNLAVSSTNFDTVSIYYGHVDSASASRTLTVTVQSENFGRLILCEYSGIASVNPVDQTANNHGIASTYTYGLLSPCDTGITGQTSAEAELFIGALAIANPAGDAMFSGQPSNGFSEVGYAGDALFLGKTATAKDVATSGLSISLYSGPSRADWAGCVATFKAAPVNQPNPTTTATPTNSPTNSPTNTPTNQPTATPTDAPTPTPIPTYTLTTDISGQGIIVPAKGTYTYTQGQTAYLSATPNNDYQFSYWKLDDNTKIYSAQTTLSMFQSRSALAVFTSTATPAPGETPEPTVEPTAVPVVTPEPNESTEPNETAPPIIDTSNFSANEFATVSGLSGIAVVGFGYAIVNGAIKPNRR